MLLSLEHMRRRARRRIPRVAFDYLDGGAGDEAGVRENRAAFDRLRFLPRALRNVDAVDPSATLFGRRWALPFGIAPIGLGNLVWPGADAMVCRAARDAGLPYTLSTAGTTAIETIRGLAPETSWFQLYVAREQTIAEDLIARAEGCEVLFVTVDVPAPARRPRDIANGLSLPLKPSLRMAADIACHPRWTAAMLRAGQPRFANIERYAPGATNAQALAAFMASQSSGRVDWAYLDWLRGRWLGRLVVKGLLAPEDVCRARDAGADAVVVSNHGGRQLEASVASLTMLPEIRRAVGPDFPLLLDSGVRSGADVVKALVAGADFVLIGRAAMYAVAAAGEAGVRDLVRLFEAEIRSVMAQLGVTRTQDLDAGLAYSDFGAVSSSRP
ncbi:alpha-hydroxy acid oxidase [Polymorphum gilvum]|uniref:L-lactate dehydrogenase (Cytochrome) n=1 Tax=Polymorphum gilvum (strain LMG 25793 / CGMCC 1.9160 / SL003B-26A1) TaxID=991905 RepID=F2IXG7_POLGS|nr:alpha-hydroxy acid oxidase [Polymorphum gilvum]ADZ71590.1 L-lactate dehydrogenase (Cytochrome) [Polymorphum gilvum SL003B-26A1]